MNSQNEHAVDRVYQDLKLAFTTAAAFGGKPFEKLDEEFTTSTANAYEKRATDPNRFRLARTIIDALGEQPEKISAAMHADPTNVSVVSTGTQLLHSISKNTRRLILPRNN
jgi:hypothetical protein